MPEDISLAITITRIVVAVLLGIGSVSCLAVGLLPFCFKPKAVQDVGIGHALSRTRDQPTFLLLGSSVLWATLSFLALPEADDHRYVASAAELKQELIDAVQESIDGHCGYPRFVERVRSLLAGLKESKDPPSTPSNVYEITEGDTLFSIAERFYGDPYKWVLIVDHNPWVDPNQIHPGQLLYLPMLSKTIP